MIQYLFFLFFVVVVLLSLLIAQMSDTFANIQDDADRIALLIRARVVISTERTGILGVVSWFVSMSMFLFASFFGYRISAKRSTLNRKYGNSLKVWLYAKTIILIGILIYIL